MARPKKIVENADEDTTVVSLQNQLAEMTRQLELLQKNNVEVSNEYDEDIDIETNIKVAADDYIKVMSLIGNKLNLSTALKGRGKTYSFRKFGEVKRIMYGDLLAIMETHPNFLEQGKFIIMSQKVVQRHDLQDLYSRLLNKKKIEDILEGNESDAINLFKLTSKSQQESIVRLIIDEVLAGKKVDLNFLDRLSREVGYNIAGRIEDMKFIKNLDEEKNK